MIFLSQGRNQLMCKGTAENTNHPLHGRLSLTWKTVASHTGFFITLFPPLLCLQKEDGKSFQTPGNKSIRRRFVPMVYSFWVRGAWAQLLNSLSSNNSVFSRAVLADTSPRPGGKSSILCLAGISRLTAPNVVQVYHVLPGMGKNQPFSSHACSGDINTFCFCRQPLISEPTQYKRCLNSS